MKQRFYSVTVAALLLLACGAFAQVPMLLNYQGQLSDPSGNPKNGTFTMQFAVYDAESGGNQLPSGGPWSETQSVTVNNGVFNVLLGSVTALPGALFAGGPSDSAGPLRFLQVTVNSETLTPRRRIVSAAYAVSGGTCVPNPSASPRFVDNGDGTVTDWTTCLMWKKKDDSGGIHDKDNPYTWSTGSPWNPDGTAFFVFLATLNGPGPFAGHSDWRLPTPDELSSIVDCSFGNPCINQTVFGPTQSGSYWSSTTHAYYTDIAWSVYFGNGGLYNHDKTVSNYARGVRGGS